MRQYRLLSPMIKVVIVLFSLLFSTAQAGLVIGGTRFAYPENQSSISVELKNTSDRDMLVKVAVSPDDARQLTGTVESLPSYSETVFIATPPLFILKPDKNTKIRINRVGGSLPADRESLFILNVAALPTLENSHSVKTDNQLQIVVAPFSHRQQSWCKSQGVCEIAWQTLDIYNNVLPILKVKLNPSQLDVTGFAFSQ